MRRKDRQLSYEETAKILTEAEYGILATVNAEGAPYTVPLSYVFKDGRVYFHCANQGHKIANLAADCRVSFCVVENTRPVYGGNGGFTTYYESAVVFGAAREVIDWPEKQDALQALCMKYLPEHQDKIADYIEHYKNRTLVYAVEPEAVTGKANRPK